MARNAREMLEQLRAQQTPARQRLEALRAEAAAGVDTSPFTLPKQHETKPSRYQPIIAKPPIVSKEDLATAETGVDISTGSPVGRLKSGFAQNQALQANDLEPLLTKHFGEPVKVRVGPQSGELEYLNPKTKRFTLVDEALFSPRDFADMVGPALTAGGATVGALGGPVGAAAGGAAGEGLRRGIGNALGVRDESALEATQGALGAGAIEGVSAVAGNVLARGAQGVRKFFRPPPLTGREAESVLLRSEANQAVADEISKRTGQRFQPFTGQMSDDPLLLGEQPRILGSRETGVAARSQLRQNETALETFFSQVNPTGGGPNTAVGRSIQQEAKGQIQPRVDALDAGVKQQVVELEKLTSALPRAQSQQVGKQLRQVAEEARTAVKKFEDSAWDGVRRGYGFDPETQLSSYKVPVSGELQTQLRRFQAAAHEALDPATESGKRQLIFKKLLPDAGAELSPDDRALLQGFDVLVAPEGPVRADLHQVQVLLSSLRKRERIALQGKVATDPSGRDISVMRDALVTQRNDYLKATDPELLAEIEAAEALTATRANLFDKGLVGGLLRKSEGQYAITDPEVVGRTIGSGNPEAIRHLVNVFSSHPAGVPTLQGAMLATYRNEVVRDGIPQAALHRRFIEQNGDAIDALFPGGAQIRQLGEFEKVVTKNIKRFEDFEANVQQIFRGRIQNLAPERVAEQALSSAFSVKDVSRIVSLAGQAGVKEEYRRAIGDQIRRRFMSETSGLNLNSLDKFVNKEAEKLSAVFGEQYIRDMRLLTKALKTAQTDAGGIAVTRKPTLIESIARSTIARPLSAPGVALTRALKFRAVAGERLLAKAIMEPDALRQIVAQSNSDIRNRKVATLLAVLGGSSLAIED